MNKVLYFAYGSNMLHERLINRVGDAPIFRTHRLYGYKLAFNAVGYNNTSYANIVRATKDDYVEGVLYELSPRQFDTLDKYEALYERNYFIITGTNYIGCTYIADPLFVREGVPSTLDYVETILKGCEYFGLKKAHADASKQLSNTYTKVRKGIKSTKKGSKTTYSFARVGWRW